ncbi:MAG TPA: allophanate hydrolase subunit 1 [Ilumatobacter sp.]
MTIQVLPMGPHAVLVDDLPGEPTAWGAGLRALGLDGVVDVVPAARTVLVRCTDRAALAGVLARLDEVAPADIAAAVGPVTVIPVTYDGADLDDVAARTGLTTNEVIERHVGASYHVAFCGFAPGFGYLRGLPAELHLPRRMTPRTRVPAGSVAIAAEYSAVYPRQSPGGWHLIGRTELVVFDVDREPPALLVPGAAVRFEPV